VCDAAAGWLKRKLKTKKNTHHQNNLGDVLFVWHTKKSSLHDKMSETPLTVDGWAD
jgi:hypothetical protein